MCQGIRYVFVGFRSNRSCWHRIVFPVRLKSTPALRTPHYYRQQQNPRRKLETFDWNKLRYYTVLSLPRTYGHFVRSQRHNFIVFSRYSGHRAASWNACTHMKSIFSAFWDQLVDFRFVCPSIKIPSSFSLKALFAVSLPWISSSSLSKYFLPP